MTTPLDDTASMANHDDAVDAATVKMNKKIVGRKKRVKGGYRLVTFGYLLYTGLFLRNSGLTAVTAYVVSGPLLTASVAHVLLRAAQDDLLSSDIYKRLNLATAVYGLASCFAVFLAPTAGQATLVWWVWFLSSLVALINSIKGYGYGLKGWKLERTSARKDLAALLQLTIQSLGMKPAEIGTWQAKGYQGSSAIVGTVQLWEGFNFVCRLFLRDATITLLDIAMQLLQLAFLLLLMTVMVTLQDEADRHDRGRVTGPTFLLQWSSVVVFGSMAAFYQIMGNSGFNGAAAGCGFFGVLTLIASLVCADSKTEKVS